MYRHTSKDPRFCVRILVHVRNLKITHELTDQEGHDTPSSLEAAEAAREPMSATTKGQQPQPEQPLQRLRRRAISIACAFGLAALVLFTWGQVCPNVKLLRYESRNAFLGALRRKQESADGAAAPPRPARTTTTRTTTVHPPFWL